MSRIIAGAAGGTTLVSVPGSLTRPTTDRVKEALFSRLDAFEVIADARVLDLYAGSGSLGVESASRGANTVDLVEFDGKASEVCQRNADLVNTVARRKVVSVHRSKVESFLERAQDNVLWDLVFLDPPYPLDEPALAAVLAELLPHLAEGAVVVVERSSRTPEPSWPDGHGAVRGTEVRGDEALVRRTERAPGSGNRHGPGNGIRRYLGPPGHFLAAISINSSTVSSSGCLVSSSMDPATFIGVHRVKAASCEFGQHRGLAAPDMPVRRIATMRPQPG